MTADQLTKAKAIRAEYESLDPNAASTRNHQAIWELRALILLFEIVDLEAQEPR